MKIVVLNGSPKGELSVTLQYVNYLAKKMPQHEFQIIHIAQRIKKIETDRVVFDEITDQVRAADGVLWAFPLYILLVHGHYKRFIELIFERGAQDAFAGKYTATLSTSIHYFDHTAHAYMHGICDDLNMRFVDSFSPEMYDLTKGSGQKQLMQFGERFLDAIQSQAPTQRQYAPITPNALRRYTPATPSALTSTAHKKVVILHDGKGSESNLAGMVARVRVAFDGEVTVANLNDVDIKSGCLGCLKCGSSYECAWTGKDGFIEFYRSTVMAADILIFAGSIVDRYLSSRWKIAFDRAFFNTHTPVLQNKQLAFLISGPLSQIPNLQEVLKGWAEFQGANLVGFVSDEVDQSSQLDALIDGLARKMVTLSLAEYTAPQTFLGVGGMKIFRDDVYGNLRFVFSADHRAYRRNGIYATFPQADWKTRLFNTFVAPFLQAKKVRKEFDKVITQQMAQNLRVVVEKA